MKKLLILSFALVGSNSHAMSTESAEKESILNQQIINGFFEKKQREITEDQKYIAKLNHVISEGITPINAFLEVITAFKELPIVCQPILPSLKEEELPKDGQFISIFDVRFISTLKEIKSKLITLQEIQQQQNTANNEKQLSLNVFRFCSTLTPQKAVSEIKRVAKNKLLHHHYNGYSEEAIADIKTLFQSEPVK